MTLPNLSVAPRNRRPPGVGDHVRLCGAYMGLVVDFRPGGIVTVAKRSRSGDVTVEADMLADGLEIARMTPLAGTEFVDRRWRRGALG